MLHTMTYTKYVYSEYFNINDHVNVDTNGYLRTMRVSDMCTEMDANPELIDITRVIFYINK